MNTENYNRWWKIMNYPLKLVPISDLKWADKHSRKHYRNETNNL